MRYWTLPGSFDAKRSQARYRLGFKLFHIIHPGGSRSLTQPRPQSCQLLVCAHCQHFYAAVRVIAHPPGNAEDMRLAFHKPAETYTLHASANKEAASLLGCLS